MLKIISDLPRPFSVKVSLECLSRIEVAIGHSDNFNDLFETIVNPTFYSEFKIFLEAVNDTPSSIEISYIKKICQALLIGRFPNDAIGPKDSNNGDVLNSAECVVRIIGHIIDQLRSPVSTEQKDCISSYYCDLVAQIEFFSEAHKEWSVKQKEQEVNSLVIAYLVRERLVREERENPVVSSAWIEGFIKEQQDIKNAIQICGGPESVAFLQEQLEAFSHDLEVFPLRDMSSDRWAHECGRDPDLLLTMMDQERLSAMKIGLDDCFKSKSFDYLLYLFQDLRKRLVTHSPLTDMDPQVVMDLLSHEQLASMTSEEGFHLPQFIYLSREIFKVFDQIPNSLLLPSGRERYQWLSRMESQWEETSAPHQIVLDVMTFLMSNLYHLNTQFKRSLQ